MSDTTIPAQNDKSVDLVIGGMTCASCAARVEKRLNKLDGVTATVNYSTERARVAFPDGVAPEELIAQVEAAGYTARLPQPPARADRTRVVSGKRVSVRVDLGGSRSLQKKKNATDRPEETNNSTNAITN